MRIHCNAKCAAIATRTATTQASASGSTESHKTTKPAATTQVAAGSSVFSPVTKTGPRHEAAQKTAGRGHRWPWRREKLAGTGTEQTLERSGKQGVRISCDAECDAISGDRVEVLARAVVLVAGMNLAEAERDAVLTQVVADLTSPTTRIPQWSSRAGEVLRSLSSQPQIRPPDPRIGSSPSAAICYILHEFRGCRRAFVREQC